LKDKDFLYIGLRCKLGEINDLRGFYECGGSVLKGAEWDW
jgi:hypothetical protein